MKHIPIIVDPSQEQELKQTLREAGLSFFHGVVDVYNHANSIWHRIEGICIYRRNPLPFWDRRPQRRELVYIIEMLSSDERTGCSYGMIFLRPRKKKYRRILQRLLVLRYRLEEYWLRLTYTPQKGVEQLVDALSGAVGSVFWPYMLNHAIANYLGMAKNDWLPFQMKHAQIRHALDYRVVEVLQPLRKGTLIRLPNSE